MSTKTVFKDESNRLALEAFKNITAYCRVKKCRDCVFLVKGKCAVSTVPISQKMDLHSRDSELTDDVELRLATLERDEKPIETVLEIPEDHYKWAFEVGKRLYIETMGARPNDEIHIEIDMDSVPEASRVQERWDFYRPDRNFDVAARTEQFLTAARKWDWAQKPRGPLPKESCDELYTDREFREWVDRTAERLYSELYSAASGDDLCVIININHDNYDGARNISEHWLGTYEGDYDEEVAFNRGNSYEEARKQWHEGQKS